MVLFYATQKCVVSLSVCLKFMPDNSANTKRKKMKNKEKKNTTLTHVNF